jgi:hypothetical protein
MESDLWQIRQKWPEIAQCFQRQRSQANPGPSDPGGERGALKSLPDGYDWLSVNLAVTARDPLLGSHGTQSNTEVFNDNRSGERRREHAAGRPT